MKKYLSSLIMMIGLVLSSNAIACNNAESCWTSGLAQHETKNYAGAASYFIKSCNYGKKRACVAAGDMSKKTRNFKNAEIYLTKACNLREKIGCNWLGDLFIEKKGNNINKGLSYKAKACNMGHIGSCVTAGNLYFKREQYAQARPMFQKACYNKGNKSGDKVGVAAGCNGLGNIMAFGFVGKANKNQALQLYKRGCQVKLAPSEKEFNEPACQNYDSEVGYNPKTLKKAIAKCIKTSGSACYQVAYYYLSKKSVGDLIKGAAYLRHPCNAGDKTACTIWERLTRPTLSASSGSSSNSSSVQSSAPAQPNCRTVAYSTYAPGINGRVEVQNHKTVCD